MFWTRLFSGIVLLAIIIPLMIVGGLPLYIVISAISVIGLFELYRTVDMHKSLPAVVGWLASIAIDYCLYQGMGQHYTMILMITIMLIMGVYVITYPKYHCNQIVMILFGLVYVTTMMSYLFQVRNLNTGVYLVWLIFISAWGSDTCAYCVGKLIGKHKMPSKLSPNKTIEGCVGGVVGAALIGFIYAYFIFNQPAAWIEFACIGAVGSVISQIGDLTASAIKRNHDIKDYGHLIPGHGGILDRFDSILFTAPVVYYLVPVLDKLLF